MPPIGVYRRRPFVQYRPYRRLVRSKATGGSTTPQSLTGTLTLSGILTNVVSKALTGSITPSGALTKAVSKALIGSITPAGALTKQGRKSHTGVLTLGDRDLNAQVTLPTSILANYPFENTLEDASVNGSDLSPVSTQPTYTTGLFRRGVTNAATGLQNAGPLASTPNVSGPWTIIAWVYSTGVPTGDILWVDDQTSTNGLGFGPNECHAFAGEGQASHAHVDTGASLSSNTWHLLVVTIDSSSLLTFYVDNASVGTSDASATAGSISGSLTVYPGTGTVIEDVTVLSQSISASQVSALWNGGTGRPYFMFGSLAQQANKNLTGTITLSATIAKLVSKALTGTITLSGSLSSIKVALQSLTGTITLSGGTVTNAVSKASTGTITLVSTLAKQANKALTGILTPGDRTVNQVTMPTPAAYYPLDNSVNDASGNGRHLSGSVTYTTGKFGSALVSGFPSYSTVSDLAATNFTLSMWYKNTGAAQSGTAGIALTTAGGFSVLASLRYERDSDTLTGSVSGSGSISVSGGTAGIWHHALLVQSGGTVALYKDGSADPSFLLAGDITGTVRIEVDSSDIGFSDVNCDDVAFWQVGLSVTQIQALWNSSTGRPVMMSGALTHLAQKALTGTLSLAGSITKAVSQAITGLLTFTGVLTTSGGTPAIVGPGGRVAKIKVYKPGSAETDLYTSGPTKAKVYTPGSANTNVDN